jgi:hypothetical protein
MNAAVARNDIAREKLVRLGALALLLVLGTLALIGPYGLLSWGEDVALLEKREHKIAELQSRRDELQKPRRAAQPRPRRSRSRHRAHAPEAQRCASRRIRDRDRPDALNARMARCGACGFRCIRAVASPPDNRL